MIWSGLKRNTPSNERNVEPSGCHYIIAST
jgi:hypothetical protein